MRNLLFCISGPSGVGKGTLVKALVAADPSLALSVSCTTRAPRKGEKDGVEYFFISREEFLRIRDEDGFIESDEHFGNFYGTPKSYVYEQLAAKRSVILEIDVVGSLIVKRAQMSGVHVVTVMIVPPSAEALEKRLKTRGSETEQQLSLRHARVEYELSMSKDYDYVVVNDDFDEALKELRAIIQWEKTSEVKS